MGSLWWYVRDGSRHGPCPKEEIENLIGQGVIVSDTMLWSEGLEDWKSLSALQTPEPPPIPESERRDSSKAEPVSSAAFPVREIVITVGTPASAGRRFLARTIDSWTLAIAIALTLGAILSLVSYEFAFWIQRPESNAIFALAIVFPLAFLLDAALYGMFRNTPGKRLLLLRVTATDGRPLAFVEYLLRNIRVWWFGLAAGIPILSMLAMIYQWRKVSVGQPTGYDIGRYRVDGAPLSRARTVGVGSVFLALFCTMVGLNVWERQDASDFRQGITWTNPVTSARIDVPPGWIYSEQKNDLGHTIHTFTAPSESLVAVFAMEDQTQSLTLTQYVRSFTSAVANSMLVYPNGSMQAVGSRVAWITNGHLAEDHARKLQFSFVQRGPQIWRFIAIGAHGRDPDIPKARELRTRLFASL